MSYFHIIIQQEQRSPRETPMGPDASRLALPISQPVPTGNTIAGPLGEMPEYVAGPQQLHTLTDKQPVKWVPNIVPNPEQKPADWDTKPEGWDEAADGEWFPPPWRETVDQGHYEFDAKTDNPQFVGVFEWDGGAPYVIAHKGDYSARTMGYAGWPAITKEEFDALPKPDPL